MQDSKTNMNQNNEKLSLTLLDSTMGDAYLVMVDEFEAVGEDYPYNNIPLAREDWHAFVAELRDEEAGINLPPGIVPQWTYVLVENRTTIMGEIRYRPATAPPFRPGHDHIGYNVRPSYRRRGYANLMLGQVLDQARADGIPGVALVVEGDNPGSVRTIAKSGGTLAEEYTDEHSTLVSVYWIALH